MKHALTALVLAAATLSAAVQASAGTRIYVQIGPPAPVVETHVLAPSPRHIWIAGYHRWDGRAYVWVPGSWAIPPAHHHAWVPGHWDHEKRGYYWIPGHWK